MRFARSFVLALTLSAAIPAYSQGCVMCSSGAEAAGQEQRRALLRGVMALLLPAMAVLGGLGVAGYRLRNRTSGDAGAESGSRQSPPPAV